MRIIKWPWSDYLPQPPGDGVVWNIVDTNGKPLRHVLKSLGVIRLSGWLAPPRPGQSTPPRIQWFHNTKLFSEETPTFLSGVPDAYGAISLQSAARSEFTTAQLKVLLRCAFQWIGEWFKEWAEQRLQTSDGTTEEFLVRLLSWPALPALANDSEVWRELIWTQCPFPTDAGKRKLNGIGDIVLPGTSVWDPARLRSFQTDPQPVLYDLRNPNIRQTAEIFEKFHGIRVKLQDHVEEISPFEQSRGRRENRLENLFAAAFQNTRYQHVQLILSNGLIYDRPAMVLPTENSGGLGRDWFLASGLWLSAESDLADLLSEVEHEQALRSQIPITVFHWALHSFFAGFSREVDDEFWRAACKTLREIVHHPSKEKLRLAIEELKYEQLINKTRAATFDAPPVRKPSTDARDREKFDPGDSRREPKT